MKSSLLWASFILSSLTRPQQDASNVEYSQFVDQISDRQVEYTYFINYDSHLF